MENWEFNFGDAKSGLQGVLDSIGIGSIGGSDAQVQFNDTGVLSGIPGFTYTKATGVVGLRKSAALILPGTGAGGLFNFALGTETNPLLGNDHPIYITHRTKVGAGNSTNAVTIITKSDTIDTGTGLLILNQGFSDASTFVIDSTNAGASAVGAFINHTTDVADQYIITLLNYHGRAIVNQARGTGTTLEIWRNGNEAGTNKGASHIYIRENTVPGTNYGHLRPMRFDGNYGGNASDSIILVNQDVRTGSPGSYTYTPTKTFELFQNGQIEMCSNLYMPNKVAIRMKDLGGTYRDIVYLNDDTNPGTLIIGADVASCLFYKGVQFGSPTGGSKGDGTINVQNGIYVNNVAVMTTYPGTGIAVSSGSSWGSSLTDNHSHWDASYISGDSPTFASISVTTDITLNNNIRVKSKDSGGTVRSLLSMGADDYVVIDNSTATGGLNLCPSSTNTNPIHIKVGGAMKNITIDANGFLKGA
jgi:hypothetical protein